MQGQARKISGREIVLLRGGVKCQVLRGWQRKIEKIFDKLLLFLYRI